MGLVALKIHAEPPDRWRIEIRQPLLWKGFYTSAADDGETWFSEGLDRVLGWNDGDGPPIGWLRQMARARRIERGDLVVAAARELLETLRSSGSLDAIGKARDLLEQALLVYDGKAAPPVTHPPLMFGMNVPEPAPLAVVGMSGPSAAPTVTTTPEQVRELFGFPVPPLGEPARSFRPVSVGYGQRIAVTPSAAGITPPRYEPTEETDEP